jgi:hypothetical protein
MNKMFNVKEAMDLYEQGYSDAEVRVHLGLSKKQWNRYLENPYFAEWVEWGNDLAEAWAHKMNREFVTKENISAQNVKSLEKRLENMHGWSSKVENRADNKSVEKDLKRLQDNLNEKLKELGYAPIDSTAVEVKEYPALAPRIDTGD